VGIKLTLLTCRLSLTLNVDPTVRVLSNLRGFRVAVNASLPYNVCSRCQVCHVTGVGVARRLECLLGENVCASKQRGRCVTASGGVWSVDSPVRCRAAILCAAAEFNKLTVDTVIRIALRIITYHIKKGQLNVKIKVNHRTSNCYRLQKALSFMT